MTGPKDLESFVSSIAKTVKYANVHDIRLAHSLWDLSFSTDTDGFTKPHELEEEDLRSAVLMSLLYCRYEIPEEWDEPEDKEYPYFRSLSSDKDKILIIFKALKYFAQFPFVKRPDVIYAHLAALIRNFKSCSETTIFAGKDKGYACLDARLHDFQLRHEKEMRGVINFLFADISKSERKNLLDGYEYRHLFERYLGQDAKFKGFMEKIIRGYCIKQIRQLEYPHNVPLDYLLSRKPFLGVKDAETSSICRLISFLEDVDSGFDFYRVPLGLQLLEADKDEAYKRWVSRCSSEKRSLYKKWLESLAVKARIYAEYSIHFFEGKVSSLCVSTESSFVPYNLLDNHQCDMCALGPRGENKKAGILYELDPAIGTLWLVRRSKSGPVTADDHRFKMGCAVVVQCTDPGGELVWLVDSVDAGPLADNVDCWRDVFYQGIIDAAKDFQQGDEKRPARLYFNAHVDKKRNQSFNDYVRSMNGRECEVYLRKVGGVDALVAAGAAPAEHLLDAFRYNHPTRSVWHSDCEGLVNALEVEIS